LIVTGIQQRLVVTATHQDKRRIMCPHGIGDKDGKLNLLFSSLRMKARGACHPVAKYAARIKGSALIELNCPT
jgi:hypothetical protein